MAGLIEIKANSASQESWSWGLAELVVVIVIVDVVVYVLAVVLIIIAVHIGTLVVIIKYSHRNSWKLTLSFCGMQVFFMLIPTTVKVDFASW